MLEMLREICFHNVCWMIGLPVLFMGIDILTGLIYAWVSKTFQSAKMRAGLAKKFGELSYIIIGFAVTYAIELPRYVLVGIVLYITFMELMSILENCDKLGAPIPAFVKAVLNNIDETLKNEEDPLKAEEKIKDAITKHEE